MSIRRIAFAALAAVLMITGVSTAAAQHADHAAPANDHAGHEMWMTTLPGGWHLMGMAHIFPVATFAAPFSSESPLNRTDINFPHAGLMANLESPDSRWVFRFMPNFEGITLPDGEPTFGGWGEGFIDARHPHTLLHEAMLSWNWWNAPAGALSLSAGRGFAPYGTEDPMYRPALKYPTNHHLSQILERWTVNLSYLSNAGLGIEVGIFDGDEPEDWLDMGNYRNFGNSFSGRLSYRFGEMVGGTAPWEVSASYGHVRETHGGHHEDVTNLFNAALRHDASYGFGTLYGLAEASLSDPEEGDGYFSLLGETQVGLGAGARHRPFYRLELATRPEYPREAQEGEGFFRYDHGDHAQGATRWLINTVGYAFEATALPVSARPFVEASHNLVRHERGPAHLEPETLFGGDSFWSFAAGVRVFFGGGPMRMGTYGVMDPMTLSMREMGMHDHPMMHEHDEHREHQDHRMEHEPHREHRMEHGEMEGMMADPGMHRAMALVVRLLDDEVVQQRIHSVHAFHEAWEDPAVQRHIQHMRQMHGGEHAHHQREHPPEHMQEMRQRMMQDPGMHRAMAFIVQLLDDAEVQARIHAVPEYHQAWEDPAVQRHLEHMRQMHGEEHQHGRMQHGQMDHGAMQDMMQDPGMHRAMALVVRLLDDEVVQQRIHSVHAFHEAWEDPAVQRHIQHMRQMHGGEHAHHQREHPPEHMREMRQRMMQDPGMHRTMAFVVQLLDDAEVQARIHAVPEYHQAWEDPAVQRHLEHMREMHGGDHQHQHQDRDHAGGHEQRHQGHGGHR
jgi:hypothetical protein